MSLSTAVQTAANQSIKDQRKTFSELPELSCDLLEDDFHLNKSYPCTQKPKYQKRLIDLQRRYVYLESRTGKAGWMPHTNQCKLIWCKLWLLFSANSYVCALTMGMKAGLFLPVGEHLDVCSSTRRKSHLLGHTLPASQVSTHFLPQPATASETEDGFLNLFISGEFCLLGYPAALNPNKVVLTVSHKTREVTYML